MENIDIKEVLETRIKMEPVERKYFFNKILQMDNKSVVYAYDAKYRNPDGGSETLPIRSVDELVELIEKNGSWQYRHFTPTTYLRLTKAGVRWDKAENIRHINSMAFDFERRHEDGSPFTREEVVEYVEDRLGVVPAFVTHSRNGQDWHVYILHTTMTGTAKSQRLHNFIQKTFAIRLGRGCQGGLGTHHRFAIPYDTIYGMFDMFGSPFLYDINHLKRLAQEYFVENQEMWAQENEKGLIRSFTVEQVMSSSAVVALMNGNFAEDVSRNHVGYTLALLQAKLFTDWGVEETNEFLLDVYYPRVANTKDHQYTEIELYRSVKSAFYGGHSVSAQWIRDLSGLPFSFAVGSAHPRKSKEDGGHNNKRENLAILLHFLAQNPYQGHQKDLIAELVGFGMSERTLQRLLPQLREEGLIDYEPKKRTGTVFAITEKGLEFAKSLGIHIKTEENIEKTSSEDVSFGVSENSVHVEQNGGEKLDRQIAIHKKRALPVLRTCLWTCPRMRSGSGSDPPLPYFTSLAPQGGTIPLAVSPSFDNHNLVVGFDDG